MTEEIKDFGSITKYEVARVIGARALQLEMGAPPLVKISGEHLDSISLAKEEYNKRVIPLLVVREKTVFEY